jgi:phosphatidylserine/phosphatidylglycerophosphate/cardiolipin synthase-like enzyme
MSIKVTRLALGALRAAVRATPLQCALQPYTKITVPAFRITGPFTIYSSPDSTYALTTRLFDAARRSILIGMYDFTASYVEQLVLAAVGRGVKVSLILDLSGAPETTLFNQLIAKGVTAVAAPSCTGRTHYFSNFHEKVIVIDDEWSLVQSGNYSSAGIPQNAVDGGDPHRFVPGNRDMGVAVQSPELAAFFTARFNADMALAIGGKSGAPPAGAEIGGVQLLAAAPSKPPVKLFPSRTFVATSAIAVQPVLTPDNYMELIPNWLATATTSVYIEEQYIRSREPQVRILLTALNDAKRRHPSLDVRIIVAAPMTPANIPQETQELQTLARDFGFALGTNVRILNPTYFVHCHNKLVILDGRSVLIGSQNWSDTAITKNREASLLIDFPEVAAHFGEIFASDWDSALKTIGVKPGITLVSAVAAARGERTVTLDAGDYEAV